MEKQKLDNYTAGDDHASFGKIGYKMSKTSLLILLEQTHVISRLCDNEELGGAEDKIKLQLYDLSKLLLEIVLDEDISHSKSF